MSPAAAAAGLALEEARYYSINVPWGSPSRHPDRNKELLVANYPLPQGALLPNPNPEQEPVPLFPQLT